jgi:cytochrome c oxidase assembly factor CtaG
MLAPAPVSTATAVMHMVVMASLAEVAPVLIMCRAPFADAGSG